MKFKVKCMDIETGHVLVALLDEKDARDRDLHALDRVKIKKGKRVETVHIDIAKTRHPLKRGEIGIFEEVRKSLKIKTGDIVRIIPARKPLSLKAIKKKLNGDTLTKQEIDQIVWDIVHNKLTQIELTYFVAACYTHIMNPQETVWLTEAMVSHGDILKLKGKVFDKHCIGGVAGNRTTMLLVPILAAAGLKIPKTSSRSITSPAGTADTMEVLCNVSVPLKKMKKIVEKLNGCIVWGGALNLAPADDKIIKVEKPIAIDAESQLVASIMSKKLSVSSNNILIDIPIGHGAKIANKKAANKLRKSFESLGKKLKVNLKVIITDGSQPIGNGIGPSLEARDVLWVLQNDENQPLDLRKKSVSMAGLMLEMAGKAKKSKGKAMAEDMISSGKAYQKMADIIKAQGGKRLHPSQILVGKYTHHYHAPRSGKIVEMHNKRISNIARVAGAPEDRDAGLYLYKHVGDKVKKGELIMTIYAQSKFRLDYARRTHEIGDGIVIK